MHRFIEQDLKTWKNQSIRKPLLVRGARQVGKSYIIEHFGKTFFESLVSINFEYERKFMRCFESLDPQTIINRITWMSGQEIQAGKTLLFLDEIQECPRAILALRYFKEKMPELHVIGAGSLLEFTINNSDYREPVGRVESLFMKPCSFSEYLIASGHDAIHKYLTTVDLKQSVDHVAHTTLIEKLREYTILGGMPEVISNYIKEKNFNLSQRLHAQLLEYYRRDFGKYDEKVKVQYLQQIFDKIPGIVAKHFKYVEIMPNIQSRDLKPALQALIMAGLVYPVYHTSASGLPLNATINEKKFKTLFLDIGLVNYATELSIDALMHEDLLLINKGALAEQFVGQELLAYKESYKRHHLYYWEREKAGSTSEVDYIINVGSQILPIEVKSGTTGRLKSLQIFLDEKQLDFGIRISLNPLSFENRILSIPLYMISELPRLIKLV